MIAHSPRRFIDGAINGANVLHVPLPWERGTRRERMFLRRLVKDLRKSA